MTSPRIRRLESDYATLRARFDGHPNIRVEPLGTVPPEHYRITYEVDSLRLDPDNRPVVVATTVVDFDLPSGYPREKPHAVAHGDVFHPNFGQYVCIADFWSPAQSLADIVLEVGEMLQWQKYNVQSPLNAIAADWAVKNVENLPVGKIELSKKTAEIVVTVKGNP
jgi:ubiquitin-protein ligase